MNLTSYEMTDLLESLRRDMRREELLAHQDPQWAEVHRFNARRSKDLLQILNPKRQRSATELEALQMPK